jgi:hypothetical protein
MLVNQDVSKVNKVIETIIREDCIVDRVFPPQIVDISSMPSDPTNPMKKYTLVRYNANLGPAYTLGIGEAPIEHTTSNGFAPAYFFKIEYFFTKKEEEVRLFEHNILDEVIIAIKERIGDQKDKIFFANGIASIIKSRNVDTVGVQQTQFLNAKYFQTLKQLASNVIIEDSTVPQSFEDNNGYHVGIKELIKAVKDKISELRTAPGLFLLPWRFWNGLSTWDFGGAGVVTFDIFIQSAERVIGGQMLVGINVQTTAKYINYIPGIPGEVQGPININVLGAVQFSDYNTGINSTDIDPNASLGYLLPSDEFFGLNYVAGPVTDIKTDIFERLPMIRLYTYYYTALAIGNSRSYLAFPAR